MKRNSRIADVSSGAALSSSRVDGLSPDLQSQAAAYAKARVEQGVDDETFDLAGARAALEASARGRDTASRFRTEYAGELAIRTVPGEEPALLYLHGGGFVGGTIRTHGHIALRLAEALGTSLAFPEYRLAPEHPFPAAFDDAERALSWLPGEGPVVVAGDSVGGALAVHLALGHPDRRRIGCLALLAPMLAFDIGSSGYLRTHGRAREMIALAAPPERRGDPRLNPLTQDLSRLPATLIQIGGADYVKADGLAFANAAVAAGAPVALEHWPNMPHVWHRYSPDAPEAERSLERAAAFLSAHARATAYDPAN